MSNSPNSVKGAGCWVLLLASLALVPIDMQGQTSAELEQRVRHLEREVADARREADSLQAEETRRAMAAFIQVEEGGFVILTIPELGETVRAAAAQAWGALAQTYQDSISVILRGFPISIVPEPKQDSVRKRLWYPPGSRLVLAPGEDPIRGLATRLLAQVHQDLWLRQDEDLRDWMKTPPPVSTDLSGAFAAAYLDLATSAAPVAQRCLTMASACGEALGLVRPGDPAAEWYGPAGRRRVAAQLSSTLQIGESRPSYDRCVTGSDADCLALLREVPELIPTPLLPPTRATFLRVALENGGPGSYPILLESVGAPMAARFHLASGMGTQPLLEEWRQHVVESRLPPTTIRPGQAFAAAGWTVLLLSFALRSSRWR